MGVDANEVFLFEDMYQTARYFLIRWDCDFIDSFGIKDWSQDENLPIGAEDYQQVASYLDEVLFTELCLALTDFEKFLDEEVVLQGMVPPVDVNVNQLIAGVNLYTTLALDYYFPDPGEIGGLTPDDCPAAYYRCDFLQPDLRFSLY